MLSNIFTGIFDTTTTSVISVSQFVLCIAISLLMGGFLAWVYTFRSQYTASRPYFRNVISWFCSAVYSDNGSCHAYIKHFRCWNP